MLARRLLTGAAVGSAGLILTAMLTGSANADPAGCSNPNSGANGLTCAHVGSNLYPGIVANLHLGTAPSCPDATAALAQAQIIVGGVNGKGGTSKRLADAQAADTQAHKDLAKAERADKAEDAKDAAITKAQDDVTAANKMPADVAPSTARADAIKKANAELDAANKADSTDDADAAVARAKAHAFDTGQRLANAQAAEGRAEQAIVDIEVIIGQACKTPAVPPVVDTPAPQPVEVAPNGQAPAPTPVEAHLPVTG